MTQINRLATGGRVNRDRPLSFKWRGKTLTGYEGDTLASALLANGVSVVARSFKYSRPRGIVGGGCRGAQRPLCSSVRQRATQIPNVRATQQALYDGLVAAPTSVGRAYGSI